MGEVSFVVAGSGYRDKRALAIAAKTCSPGHPIKLVREPANKFDPNAVQVWIEPPGARLYMLGYVPRDIVSRLAPLLDRDRVMVGGRPSTRVSAQLVTVMVDPNKDFDPIRFKVEVMV